MRTIKEIIEETKTMTGELKKKIRNDHISKMMMRVITNYIKGHDLQHKQLVDNINERLLAMDARIKNLESKKED
jgi:polyhydroxyalkanoate synthesis regulator phasin